MVLMEDLEEELTELDLVVEVIHLLYHLLKEIMVIKEMLLHNQMVAEVVELEQEVLQVVVEQVEEEE